MGFIALVLFPFFSDAQYQFIQKGNDIDGEAVGDLFGKVVCMPDSLTLAVGAPQNDSNGLNAGLVRIFEWNDSVWLQKGNTLLGESSGDLSGWSIDMPGPNTIAIGAPWSDANGANSGHVRVFAWNGVAWIQKGDEIKGESSGDLSGCSVSMPSTNIIAVGSRLAEYLSMGHVRIFEWNGSSWIQKGPKIKGTGVGEEAGFAVSMPDANTVAIGSPYHSGNGLHSGAVKVYTWNGSFWIQKGLDIYGESSADNSGWSVSMPDATTVAIGAPGNQGTKYDTGHVRVYSWNGTAWIQKGNDIDGDNPRDESGSSLSMPDANTLAIGSENGGSGAGEVRVFQWNNGVWSQVGGTITGNAENDEFGHSVSMPHRNSIAIGGPFNDNNGISSGHVRTFEITSTVGNRSGLVPGISGIKIFPNPTIGPMSILASENKPARIRVMDLTGKEIVNTSYQETIHIPQHLTGVFVIELEIEGHVYRQKILKL